MKLIKPFFMSLILLSSTAYAEPMNFMNLNWRMSANEIKDKLQNQGYKCAPNPLAQIVCSKSLSIIIIDRLSHLLYFNCKSYKGCEVTMDKMAEAIADKYKISLRRTRELNPVKICGEGKAKDKICVVNEDGIIFPHSVHLYKHMMDAQDPEF